MYDIAIIGLGPGGATLARLLDADLRVVAIDKKGDDPVHGFRKPCGGLLATDAQKALSKFGLTLPKDVLVDPQIFAVKTMDTGQHLLRHYQRFYINMDRHKFDRWLISFIPPSVRVVENAVCTHVQRIAEGYAIIYRQGGVTHTITSRFVVGADGSRSIVRESLFPHRTIRRYLSIQQWFADQGADPFYSCVFDRAITDSYCWSIAKDGFLVLGGAFPVRDGKARFELLKAKLEQLGFSLGDPVRTEACLVSMPRRLRDFCAGGDGAFLLGEAAGFISPSSLEGISYALNSACSLAAVLSARRQNPALEYRLRTLPIRGKLLLKLLKSPFMYWPFLRKCVMKSGLSSIRVIEKNSSSR